MYKFMKYIFFIVLFLGQSISIQAQTIKKINSQQSFRKTVPPGNYSGMAYLGDDLYAVVSDKSDEEGFFVFRINIDSVSGKIRSANYLYFQSLASSNRDAEGIAWMDETKTLLIVGEKDNKIIEYELNGTKSGREISLEPADGNYGYESLTYNVKTATLWTCTENMLPCDKKNISDSDSLPIIRLQSFDDNLRPKSQYLYRMDAPRGRKSYRHYAHGISELLALDNGALLVLEREFAVPAKNIGAYVSCKLYRVNPSKEQPITNEASSISDMMPVSKILMGEWTTRLTLVNYSIANYEGMCIGPRLTDGSRVIVMVADSQNQKGGVLRDWFRTIVISE